MTLGQLKAKIVQEYNTSREDKSFELAIDKCKIRIPKLEEDLGDVVNESELVDNCDIFDGKLVYLQITKEGRLFEYVNQKDPNNAYYIMVREWDCESWQFGPIYEVKVDK